MNARTAMIRTALAASAALCLSACGGNATLESVHTPAISTLQMSHDVYFGSSPSLAAPEAAALESFLSANDVRYGDRLKIDDPNPIDATTRRTQIGAVAAKFGLLLDDAPAAPSRPALANGAVRLVVARGVADHPDCPDWQNGVRNTTMQKTSSNFGCAQSSNLASMIADPADLQRGRTYSGTDSATVTKAINSWRDTKPTGEAGLQDVSASSANDQ